ncbi:MAG TPA: chromosomal replication initiator protein DnaA [Dehalococcoidia bacterium]|nr:chromosomal replication initiator protein DnaA [Dehalococcoidia bacterium]
MNEVSSREVWRAVLGELQLQLPRATFETWLKQTDGISCDGQIFVVEVPTAFTVAWLERRMYQFIQKTVEKVAKQSLEVQFHVKDSGDNHPSLAGAITHGSKPSGFRTRRGSSDDGLENSGSTWEAEAPILNPKYTFDSFVVGSSNHMAFSAARAVCEAPGQEYNPLFIYSGVGLGKTHLLHAIGHQCAAQGMSVLYATSEQFTNEFISAILNRTTEAFRNRYRSVQVLLMDDVQFLSGKEQTHEGFFHTFNDLHNSGHQVVITADRPPRSLALLEDRLRSRFEWGLTTDIQAPNLETRMAILAAKAEQIGVVLRDNIIEMVAKRVQKNVRELEGTLNRLVAFAQLGNSPITPESTLRILDDLHADADRHSIDPDRIIEEAANHYKLSPRDILGRSRTKRIALARQVVMYLLIHELELSPTQVGRLLGGRDHATIIHGAGKVSSGVNENGQLRKDVLTIKEAIFALEPQKPGEAVVGISGR